MQQGGSEEAERSRCRCDDGQRGIPWSQREVHGPNPPFASVFVSVRAVKLMAIDLIRSEIPKPTTLPPVDVKGVGLKRMRVTCVTTRRWP